MNIKKKGRERERGREKGGTEGGRKKEGKEVGVLGCTGTPMSRTCLPLCSKQPVPQNTVPS